MRAPKSQLSQFKGKDDESLLYIIKDAGRAARNMHSIGDAAAESKYLDQVLDATTVLAQRYPGLSYEQIRARVDARYDDVDVTVECHACGGETYYLGNLGRREYYRCRRCGVDNTRERS